MEIFMTISDFIWIVDEFSFDAFCLIFVHGNGRSYEHWM